MKTENIALAPFTLKISNRKTRTARAKETALYVQAGLFIRQAHKKEWKKAFSLFGIFLLLLSRARSLSPLFSLASFLVLFSPAAF